MSVWMALVACGGGAAPEPALAPEDPAPTPLAEGELTEADEDPETDLDADHHRTAPGAPVEGIRHWAEPGDLDTWLAARRDRGFPTLKRRVKVKSVEELIKALAPDTLILLQPGDYVFGDSAILASDGEGEEGEGAPPPVADWSGWSEHYDDNTIHDVTNLVIANGGDAPVRILQPDSYAAVLKFERVRQIGLFGLTLGHRPDRGWCMGDVLRFVDGAGIEVVHSTMFGSGTEGLSVVSVDGLRVENSVITDCTEGFGTISHSRVLIEGSKVAGNTEDLLRGFTIYRSDVTLRDTVLEDNHALVHSDDSSKSYDRLFSVDDDYDQGRRFVDEPKPVEPGRSATTLQLERVTVDGAAVTWPP